MAARKRVVEVARKRSAPQVQTIKVVVLPDEDPDTSWMDDPENDDRREAYERGAFSSEAIDVLRTALDSEEISLDAVDGRVGRG